MYTNVGIQEDIILWPNKNIFYLPREKVKIGFWGFNSKFASFFE